MAIRSPQSRRQTWISSLIAGFRLSTPTDLLTPANAYRSLPIFGGGGASTVAISITLSLELRETALMIWAAVEVALVVARLAVVVADSRAGTESPGLNADWHRTIDIAGGLSVGLGAAVAIATGVPLGWALGLISAAAFAGESGSRNLSRPGLAAAMIAIGCLPPVCACFASGEPILGIAGALMGIFAIRMMRSAANLSGLIDNSLRAERDSDYQARHDRLTGLLNRAGLEREIELMRRDQPRSQLTLFFVDLDRFKQVNDSLGHDMGDRLLRAVAEQLLELAASRDIVARFGGDEFILVTSLGLAKPEEFGAAILSAVRGACDQLGIAVGVTASVGISQAFGDSFSLTELLTVADTGLYEAKRSGGDRWSMLSTASQD